MIRWLRHKLNLYTLAEVADHGAWVLSMWEGGLPERPTVDRDTGELVARRKDCPVCLERYHRNLCKGTL